MTKPEEKLSSMKAQVYKDPRPKEFFDKYHERVRTREPNWIYEAVRVCTSLYAWSFFRLRSIDELGHRFDVAHD